MLQAVGLRRRSGNGLKHRRKIVLVVEAGVFGDVVNGQRRVRQEALAVVDARTTNVIGEGHVHFTAEQVGEVAAGQLGVVGHIGQC